MGDFGVELFAVEQDGLVFGFDVEHFLYEVLGCVFFILRKVVHHFEHVQSLFGEFFEVFVQGICEFFCVGLDLVVGIAKFLFQETVVLQLEVPLVADHLLLLQKLQVYLLHPLDLLPVL